MRYLIYALVDPRNEETRYVGKSSSGLQRPRMHRCPKTLAKDFTYKGNWIREMLRYGVSYSIVLLYSSPVPDKLNEAEVFWIAEMKRRGNRLTNLTPGGDGWAVGRKHSEETKRKISAANKGRKCSPEHCKKNGDAHRGQDMTKAWEASSAVTKGKKRFFSAEHRANIRAAKIGRRLSAAHIEKLRQASIGRKHSEESKRKITGRPKSSVK